MVWHSWFSSYHKIAEIGNEETEGEEDLLGLRWSNELHRARTLSTMVDLV